MLRKGDVNALFQRLLSVTIGKQDKGVVRLAPANSEKHRPATPCGDYRIYQDFPIMKETLTKYRQTQEISKRFIYQDYCQRLFPARLGQAEPAAVHWPPQAKPGRSPDPLNMKNNRRTGRVQAAACPSSHHNTSVVFRFRCRPCLSRLGLAAAAFAGVEALTTTWIISYYSLNVNICDAVIKEKPLKHGAHCAPLPDRAAGAGKLITFCVCRSLRWIFRRSVV